MVSLMLWCALAGGETAGQSRWAEAMVRSRRLAVSRQDSWQVLEADFPVECDWFVQDLVACGLACSANASNVNCYPARWFSPKTELDLERRLIARVAGELGDSAVAIRAEAKRLEESNAPAHDRAWLDLYAKACARRRAMRLQPMAARCPTLVFTKHATLGGSHYAYTEAQSDAQAERHFLPGAALCLLELEGTTPKVRTLLDDPLGMIRDPDVSYDGRRVLLAWKRSDRQDDFHLYEMELVSGKIRQLTFGLGLADYEGCYLPNGDILFNSTRCVQTVDCWHTEVSNLYTCDKDGRHLRRVSFDQVHTNFPTVTADGRVLYTRWEYNDRGQIYPQALFQMNADGTGQGEFYGNNSYFPTTILHARNIVGTQKVLAIASGHHSRQTGKLVVIDPARGRQENSGVQLAAPVRDTPAERIDRYGQDGELFQYPYPLSETEYLVTYTPWGWARKKPLFGLYFMTIDGRRELLAADPNLPCSQPVPVRRPAPHDRPSMVDYTKNTGVFYVQDVYAGPGLQDVPRGKARSLRVVALDFRAADVGANGNKGPAGAALVSTPVAISNGCWDPKIVLGETPIHEDGSAMFTVPAATPVYFQVLDEKGYMIQTMRSWSTLQPGETGSCVGCHEEKNSAPQAYRKSTIALRHGPKPLDPFYGPPRGFSFPKEIQPILDRHCTSCHVDRSEVPAIAATLTEPPRVPPGVKKEDVAFSLLSAETVDPRAKRRWSDAYLALTNATQHKRGDFQGVSTPMVNWVSVQSAPPMLPSYSAGAATSKLMPLLEQGHKDVHLSREELRKLACWIDLLVPYCGDYREASAWTAEESERYDHFLAKRARMEAIQKRNVRELLLDRKGLSTPDR